jgi:hypothetical protein
MKHGMDREKKAFCVLEFSKTESIVTIQRTFQTSYHPEPPTEKNNSCVVHEIPAEGLPVRGETHRPACLLRSTQVATLLEFHVPLTNCFFLRWFCVVHGPKPPLYRHNWFSFGKFQDTERFLIPCPHHVSSRLPSSGETCKYATVPSKQTNKKNLEKFSIYWFAPFCCVCPGCYAADFGSSGRIYELPCIF